MSNFNLGFFRRRGTNSDVASSFAVLFRTHAPFVWRVLRRHGVAERELEDACQEVFVVVHRKQADFEGRSTLRTWLYAIARRVAAHHTRAARSRPELSVLPQPELVDSEREGPEAALDQKRRVAWLDAALCELDPEKREVFILYEIELLTLAEVAQASGASESTVLYRLQAARDGLRVALKRRELVVRAAPVLQVAREAP
jgi:RNA polymerase sigma-70 factor (ECF subfamily)